MDIADLLRCYSILASTPFKFLVGSDRKLLTVHSALVAHHSETLGVLVNGNMSEAKEGCALLEDVDVGTFVRFSQYAYTGDYVAVDPDIVLDSSMIASPKFVANEALADDIVKEASPRLSLPDPHYAQPEPVPKPVPEPTRNLFDLGKNSDDWDTFPISKKDKKKAKARSNWAYAFEERASEAEEPAAVAPRSKKSELWGNFKSKAYVTSMPTFQPRTNREACEDYTEVFLCHARLYVFADTYNVGPLKDLALHKLQRTLAQFTLYDERLEDIVKLLRYSYSNTSDRSESVDDLRLLVVHYSACVVEDLLQSEEFRLLLEKVGSLSRDLVVQMLARLD